MDRRMPAWLHAIRRFHELSWRNRLLLAEAWFWLAAASVAIAVLPFRVLVRLAAWPRTSGATEPNLRASAVWRVRWAIRACARRAAWRAVCFQQGLAAHWMLRRRGVASELHYGVAPDAEAGLAAHVWVRSGGRDVVGGAVAPRFAPLVSIPAAPAGTDSLRLRR